MNFQSKLQKLEADKQSLIEKRLFEIAKLVEKADILSLDNNIILGALLWLKEAQETNDVKLIDEFSERAKKMPSRKKRLLKKSKKTDTENTLSKK